MINIEKLTKELKRDEGYRDKVYTCSAGKLTIGYGHNVEDNPIPETIATALLGHDIGQALAKCEQWAWFYPLSDVRKRVIVNMVFNIGAGGVARFRRMISAIEAEDWKGAAEEMKDSRWFDQVGKRATRLAHMMEYDTDV